MPTRCVGCQERLDKRGRNVSGYCRTCFNALPPGRRLPLRSIVEAVNCAPTEILCRALEARGVTVLSAGE